MGLVMDRVINIAARAPTARPINKANEMIVLEVVTMPKTLALLVLDACQASLSAVRAVARTVSPIVFIWGRISRRSWLSLVTQDLAVARYSWVALSARSIRC